MIVDVEKLPCGCRSWIDGVDVHVQACRRAGHYDSLLATAKSSGLPVAEAQP